MENVEQEKMNELAGEWVNSLSSEAKEVMVQLLKLNDSMDKRLKRIHAPLINLQEQECRCLTQALANLLRGYMEELIKLFPYDITREGVQ